MEPFQYYVFSFQCRASVVPLLFIFCTSAVHLLFPKGCKLPMVDLEQIEYRKMYLYQIKVFLLMDAMSYATTGGCSTVADHSRYIDT
mgnify:CR=1 FL=1